MYFIGLGLYFGVLLLGGQWELFHGGVFTPHDAFYPVTDFLDHGAFGEYLARNNFERNFISWFIHIPDLLFISVLKLFMSNSDVQVTHVIFCYVLMFTVAYYCFGRLIKNRQLLCLLTLSYCLSPYMAVLYSGGTFYTFSTIISLGILPLFLCKLIKLPDELDFLGLVTLFMILSYGVIFAYPALLTLVFSILGFYFFVPKIKRDRVSEALLNSLKINRVSILLYGVALLPLILFGYVYLFQSGSGITENNNPLQNGMYAAIKGSLIYPLMQISSWAIYNPWTPRVVMNFSDWYFETPYKVLSLSLIIAIFYFSVRSKNYRYLGLIVLCAFFAKGTNPPFEQVFSLIINHFPLGFLIRSPDTKFGAFISALILLSVLLTPERNQKTTLIVLILAFLVNNILGMYSHGSLSPNKGSSTTTYYQYDSEYQAVVKKINAVENAVVLTNLGICDVKLENKKMFTCSDLVLSNVDKQIIGSSFGNLEKLSSKFDIFTRLIYVNHSVVGGQNVDIETLIKQGYIPLYSSAVHTLLIKQSEHPPCSSLNLPTACILYGGRFIVSSNISYANYYWAAFNPRSFGELVSLDGPPSKPSLVNYWRLCGIYLLGFIASLLALFLGIRKKFSSN